MKNIGKIILAAVIITIFAFQVNAQNAATSNQPAQKQNAVKSASGNVVDADFPGIDQYFRIANLFYLNKETGQRNFTRLRVSPLLTLSGKRKPNCLRNSRKMAQILSF